MVQTIKPRSTLLQRYIDFFYVFDSTRPETISYIAFPHVNTAISFFKGTDIQRGDHSISITANPQNNHCQVEILGKFTQPVFVHYTGRCEELAIVFKPLGVNHFFLNDLREIAPLFSQELTNERWTAFAYDLFNEISQEKKIEMLELFLIHNYRDFGNKPLYDALSYLQDFDTPISMEEIAALCGFAVKTFQRNFKKHVSCSPSEYRRIARFRHSLQNKLISDELKTLTRISYASNYYDQSYFVREFKKLTHLNPGKFFNSITALDEKKIVWKVK